MVERWWLSAGQDFFGPVPILHNPSAPRMVRRITHRHSQSPPEVIILLFGISLEEYDFGFGRNVTPSGELVLKHAKSIQLDDSYSCRFSLTVPHIPPLSIYDYDHNHETANSVKEKIDHFGRFKRFKKKKNVQKRHHLNSTKISLGKYTRQDGYHNIIF